MEFHLFGCPSHLQVSLTNILILACMKSTVELLKVKGRKHINSFLGCLYLGTSVKPRQVLPDIDKLGLKNYFKGWVDAQNQGVPNDYAYYVEPTEDIPFPWLTVALAGSTNQRTCAGTYQEKYGVVRSKSEYPRKKNTVYSIFNLLTI